MLLKVVLFGYSQGLLGSRPIARACARARDATFIALSGDNQPHFTTLAHFVSTLGDDIATVFGAVLAICQRQGLIGGELFAIDSVKLPSNAAKHKSGTRADFERHASKLVKSNRTDNESAKMATEKGVIQGYTGVAAVEAKHQIIVAAQAHGTGAEQALLMPMVDATAALRQPHTLITADAGYYSLDNLVALDAAKVEALLADNQMRKRDPRLDGQARHTAKPAPLYDKSGKPNKAPCYAPADFTYDAMAGTCVCPAGKSLYRHGSNCRINDRDAVRYQGAKRDCLPCAHRERCLRTPDKTPTRQVAFFNDKNPTPARTLCSPPQSREQL